jgi:hypothetical protein
VAPGPVVTELFLNGKSDGLIGELRKTAGVWSAHKLVNWYIPSNLPMHRARK